MCRNRLEGKKRRGLDLCRVCSGGPERRKEGRVGGGAGEGGGLYIYKRGLLM